MVALHTKSLHRMLDLANAFLPALLLHSYKQPAEVNDLVLALLVQETHADLLWVFQLVQQEKVKLAQFVVKHRVRKHFRRFESDVFGLG